MAMEWVTALLAKKGSRHGVPYCMPPMIGPLKYSAESLVISVDQWKPLQLRVTDILSLLWMNGGGEYMSQAFSNFLSSCRVKHEVTNAYTPQENGVLEHANRTINNLAQSMIADAKEALNAKALPLALWSQVVHHAVWIKNCI